MTNQILKSPSTTGVITDQERLCETESFLMLKFCNGLYENLKDVEDYVQNTRIILIVLTEF